MVSALNGKARIGGLLLLYFVATSTLAVVSDATNLFVITKTGFVLNRTTNTYDTTVTLKNISPLAVNAPVQLVVSGLPSGVTLANAAGTNQGKPYVNVTVPGNSIIAGQIVTPIVLKFSNPSRVTITATLAMSADIPQAAVGLPPDPGEPGKATVAGIDSNGNGVRDDVERWIGFTFQDSVERQALAQAAKGLQASILNPTNEEAAHAAGLARAMAAQCLGNLFQSVTAGQDAFGELLGKMLNTERRFLANQESTRHIGHLLIGQYPNDGCDFWGAVQ